MAVGHFYLASATKKTEMRIHMEIVVGFWLGVMAMWLALYIHGKTY